MFKSDLYNNELTNMQHRFRWKICASQKSNSILCTCSVSISVMACNRVHEIIANKPADRDTTRTSGGCLYKKQGEKDCLSSTVLSCVKNTTRHKCTRHQAFVDSAFHKDSTTHKGSRLVRAYNNTNTLARRIWWSYVWNNEHPTVLFQIRKVKKKNKKNVSQLPVIRHNIMD